MTNFGRGMLQFQDIGDDSKMTGILSGVLRPNLPEKCLASPFQLLPRSMGQGEKQ